MHEYGHVYAWIHTGFFQDRISVPICHPPPLISRFNKENLKKNLSFDSYGQCSFAKQSDLVVSVYTIQKCIYNANS